jgi:hypothetical protein
MANNYVQGTISPDLPLTDAQVGALGMDAQDMPAKDEIEERAAWLREEGEAAILFTTWVDEFGLEYGTGINLEKHRDKWYLYCENGLDEGGDAVLQDLLKALPTGITHITYEYAAHCSKLRPDEFGGGACFITRDDIQWTSTSMWLHQQRQKLKEVSDG